MNSNPPAQATYKPDFIQSIAQSNSVDQSENILLTRLKSDSGLWKRIGLQSIRLPTAEEVIGLSVRDSHDSDNLLPQADRPLSQVNRSIQRRDVNVTVLKGFRDYLRHRIESSTEHFLPPVEVEMRKTAPAHRKTLVLSGSDLNIEISLMRQPIPEHSHVMRGALTYESDALKKEVNNVASQDFYIDPTSYPPRRTRKSITLNRGKASQSKIKHNILQYVKMTVEQQDQWCNEHVIVSTNDGSVYSELKEKHELRAKNNIKKYTVIGEYKGTVCREIKSEIVAHKDWEEWVDPSLKTYQHTGVPANGTKNTIIPGQDEQLQAEVDPMLTAIKNCYTFRLLNPVYCLQGFPLSNEIALINDGSLPDGTGKGTPHRLNTFFINIAYKGEYRVIAIATKNIRQGDIFWCQYSDGSNNTFWDEDQGDLKTITLEEDNVPGDNTRARVLCVRSC